MNKLYYLIFFLILSCKASYSQSVEDRKVHNQHFKWSMIVPENFEKVPVEEWTALQKKGEQAIEKTYDAEINNSSKTIFVFKSGQFNYLECNEQPFDIAGDRDFKTSFKGVGEILYQTFTTQMPGVKVEKELSEEDIDNLKFQSLKMQVTYPNNAVLNLLMFSRLFENRQFTVNIMFIDEAKGKLMLEAWKQSRFEKD